MTITASELLEISRALQLIADTKAALQNGNLLDVVQPNGKRFGDCTGEECRETGEWMMRIAARLDILHGKTR